MTPRALPPVPKETKQWVHDNFPPMPLDAKMEFAGLEDFDAMYNAIAHAIKHEIGDNTESVRIGLSLAYVLEELGFHR